jgi:RNA 2',3'-cyclic 3'-phosphodiesterase
MPHRLFAAIRPPPEAIDALLALETHVPGARWQDEDQLHLTLRFFGALETRQADELAEALALIAARPFALALRGVGHFERKGRPHTLWVGLAPSDALGALQRKVEMAARACGLAPERRRFAPHVTLARLRGGGGPILSFLQTHGALKGEPWQVEAFDLVESTLTPAGSIYETVRRYRLSVD